MKKSFLPFLHRWPDESTFGSGGGLFAVRKSIDSGTSGSSSSTSSTSSAGSSSIWETLAANAGETLGGLATLYSAVAGKSVAPTTNNYNAPSNGSNFIVVGVIGIVVVAILFIAFKPKK